jgi:hypothetical protein
LDQFEEFERFFHLRQGTRSAQEFALEFRTLAAGAGWNDRALIDHYHCSLREDVRRELACRDTTLTFDQLVDLLVPSPSTPSPIPMELGGAVCRETGGGSSSCTICGRRVGSSGYRDSRQGALASTQVSRHHSHPEPSAAHMFVYVTFSEFSRHSQHMALVDSVTAGNFIDRSFAHSLGIPIVPVAVPFPVHALDSRPLGSGLIREATAPLGMVTHGDHKERISLFLIDSPAFPMVLGLHWLVCHGPTVSWPQRALTGWS